MKYIFLLLLAILSLPTHADAVWFDSNWDYKVKVEVNPNKVGSSTAITSYPVYNDCGGFPSTFWTNASSTGADIRVLENGETTETAFELVSFSTTSKKCELHFMADTLATTSSSTFYIYYGNVTATAYAVTDTYGRNNVWTGYKSVYHLESLTSDSTSGGYTLTNNNSVSSGTGKISSGADFGAANTNKTLTTTSQLGLAVNDARTFSTWVNISTTPGAYDIMGMGYNATDVFYVMEYIDFGAGNLRLRVGRGRNGVDDPNLLHTTTLTTGSWYHLAYTIDASRNQVLYLNGTLATTSTAVSGNGAGTTLDGTVIARNLYSTAAARLLKGLTDETKISGSVLTSSWVSTEYNNQSSTSTFFYIGPEQTNATGTPATSTPSSIIWFE
jgi:hypothetical protein